MELAVLSDDTRGDDRETGTHMTVRELMRRCAKAAPLVAVLALGLALSACDKCGDFPWNQPGSCKAGPAPS